MTFWKKLQRWRASTVLYKFSRIQARKARTASSNVASLLCQKHIAWVICCTCHYWFPIFVSARKATCRSPKHASINEVFFFVFDKWTPSALISHWIKQFFWIQSRPSPLRRHSMDGNWNRWLQYVAHPRQQNDRSVEINSLRTGSPCSFFARSVLFRNITLFAHV